MLLLWDRGFFSYRLWQQATATGAQVLARYRAVGQEGRAERDAWERRRAALHDREPELADSEADHGPQERGVRPVR